MKRCSMNAFFYGDIRFAAREEKIETVENGWRSEWEHRRKKSDEYSQEENIYRY